MAECMEHAVCGGRFDSIEYTQQATNAKIDKLSKKLFESNGERALVEVIRDNTKGRGRLEEKLDQHISEAVPLPAKTIKRLKVGKFIDMQGFNAADVLKILLMVTILAYILGRDHGPALVGKIIGNPTPELSESNY